MNIEHRTSNIEALNLIKMDALINGVSYEVSEVSGQKTEIGNYLLTCPMQINNYKFFHAPSRVG